MSYDRLNWSYPIPEKGITKKKRYETIQGIHKLSLPPDITKQLILFFKYDILEKQYVKNYRKVLFELKQFKRRQRLSKRIDDTFPSVPVPPDEKQVVVHELYPSPPSCPSQKPTEISIF